MSLAISIRKRATARSSMRVVVTANVLKEELNKVEPDKSVLEDKFIKLQTVNTELKSYNPVILDLMIAAEVTDDDLNNEVISCVEYLDEFISLRRLIKEKTDNSDLNISMRSKTDCSISARNDKRYKLPNIQIKKFDGHLLSYLSFWGQFKRFTRTRIWMMWINFII
ncbi:hypothetical protein CEXT_716871 [Caerostris extrusa]|uniref:Uncharacterized protein n=1 Tax=Caerostris extrusa TaxID=172846 RepID=A0AAV4NFQ3_CAEEX|nr:hypothetical protein CEXT_716871 [Caerostris extrusa]